MVAVCKNVDVGYAMRRESEEEVRNQERVEKKKKTV